jgi:hypothetical protein
LNTLKISDLQFILDDIFEEYGDLDVKVYQTSTGKARHAEITLGEGGKGGVSCVLFIDKEGLLKIPFDTVE